MKLRDSNDSTHRNEAARKKIKQEHDDALAYTQQVADKRWPPRVLKAVVQAKLSRRFGQGL